VRTEQQNFGSGKTAAHCVNTGDSGHSHIFPVSDSEENANCVATTIEHLTV
jgi:hypothetical protein